MRRFALALAALGLAGCQAGYYSHLLRGQYELMSRREPIERVVARPGVDAQLKARLERALDARRFASEVLRLPDNGSYRQYADLKRPYALWNVFATPEFSLAPREWCYWLAGCFAYRGYYDLEAARAAAAALAEQGDDVHVAGVPAYSTLGWFDDPLLNTVLATEDGMAATLFHELAHQQVFVRGDTAFNESFATFVEEEGLRRYLAGLPALAASAQRRQRRAREFVALMLRARAELERLYASGLPASELRAPKADAFVQLRETYAAWKRSGDGDDAYDGWMAGELNNAMLAPFGLYHEWVPSFAALFARAGGDWPAFYRAVEALAREKPDARRARLEALRPAS